MTETDAQLVTRVLALQGLTVRDGHIYTPEGVLVESLRARAYQYLESESGWGPLLFWAMREGYAPVVAGRASVGWSASVQIATGSCFGDAPHPGRALCEAIVETTRVSEVSNAE